MTNRHIKIINGRKYYYASVRKGKKVTSKYLGPVDERRRRAREDADMKNVEQEPILEEDSYIG
jgi:hypothetical protein